MAHKSNENRQKIDFSFGSRHDLYTNNLPLVMTLTFWLVHRQIQLQGGHGTGKTGNLVLTFSRQGKHREFRFDTGKNFETQGKYFSVTQGKNLDTGEIFDCDY